MTTKETLAFRLDAIHTWVRGHAKKSARPSLFLDYYDDALKTVRKDPDPDAVRVDHYDPVRLAADIEARAALRRAQDWHSRKGLLR